MRLFRAILLPLALVLAAQADGQQPAGSGLPDSIQKITTVEGITQYQLPNGLEVLLFPDPSSATVTVNVTYLVGSVDESYGETGMAHLLEHMMFKGTPEHPDTLKELQDRGASFNGTTSYERTNYYETLDGTEDNLSWALEFEADRMTHSKIAQADLDSEMTVVRNEFESGENNPVNILYERVLSTSYLWHAYGKSPIGSRSDIENVPIERLQAFYRAHYQPDNAVLIVAGKIDEQKTLDLVARDFGPIPKPARTLIGNYTVEPVQDGERTVTLRRVGNPPTVMVGFHAPPGTHEDFVPLQIAEGVLADTPSGRLYKALVEPGLATNVGSDDMQLKDPGMVIFYAMLPPDSTEADVDKVREIMISTIEGLAAKPLTDEEVQRIKNQSLSGLERLMNNSQAIALQLSSWAAIGDWRMLFFDRDRVRSAATAKAQAAALHYFKGSNSTVGRFIPEETPDRASIPEGPVLSSLLEGYKGDEGRALGEAFDPSPANIDARTVRRTLPSGIEVAMLPKETRGNQVNVTIRLHLGDLKSLTGKSTIASMTGAMLMRGTTMHTRQQLQDELARLQSVLSVGGGAGTFSASIQSTRENLPAVLDLAFEVLEHPSFPAAEFNTLKDNSIASIDSQRTEPDAIASIALSRHLGENYERGDPRYTPTIDESIEDLKAVQLDDLQDFYKEFLGASHAHIAAVGDFDPDQFAASIESGLGGFKSREPYEQIISPYPDPVPPAANESFNTPDKENAYFLAAMPVKMNEDDADYPALMLGVYILGDGAGSRLFARIRGKEGLSYGAYAGFSAPVISNGAQFSAQAIAAPQNVPKVEASFDDEIKTILRDGYSADEVATAKSSWAQSRQISRSQDRSLVGLLATQLHYNRTMQWDADLEAKVQALTPEQIVDVMRRYLDPDGLTIVKAGDFDK